MCSSTRPLRANKASFSDATNFGRKMRVRIFRVFQQNLRNLCIRRLIPAALRTNGWFSRCAAAPGFTLTQHFPRCERTQQENRIYRMGSVPSFRVSQSDDRFQALNVRSPCHPFEKNETSTFREWRLSGRGSNSTRCAAARQLRAQSGQLRSQCPRLEATAAPLCRLMHVISTRKKCA